jgi:general nucleoside transport system permease protein
MLRRFVTGLSAPALAIALALGITCLILLATNDSPSAFLDVLTQEPKPRNVTNIINNASILYLSALAAAIGFRMNLFNIGVEGQYQMAVFAAAVVAGSSWIPGPFSVIICVLLAMVVGAIWAAIPAILKVTRGVSEVISTIMLNAIAVSITGFLLRKWGESTGSNLATKTIPGDSRVPGIQLVSDAPNKLLGLSFIAVAAGIAYVVLLNYSRFGFALRATGRSATAAAASGIDVRRMTIYSMLISGAVAGLIGLPSLFGDSYSYGTTFQAGLGFSGIAVALLGRNSALGMVFGALLFTALDEQSSKLEINAHISAHIVEVTKGVIVLSVVIAYEVVRRYLAAAEQRRVAAQLAAERRSTPPADPTPALEAAR